MTHNINQLRQLLCEPDTPALRTQLCALCTNDMMWDHAEAHVPGLRAWSERQADIAAALEKHRRRHDEGEVYEECRFSMKHLHRADLFGANLRYAYLEGADLEDANLEDANLSSADLEGANLRSADLSGAFLFRADLSSADLRDADLEDASLIGARYNEYTVFPFGFNPVARGMVEVSE